MAQATNSRRSAKWGQAKTSVSVLAPEIRKLRDQGLSWREIYARLEMSGKTEGFSLPSFYRWLRDNTSEGRKKQSAAKKVTSTVPVPPTTSRSPKSTILPASPVVSGDLPPSLFGDVNLEDWADQMLGGDADGQEGGE